MANTRSRSKKSCSVSVRCIYTKRVTDVSIIIHGSRTDVPIMWGTFVTWAWQIKRCGVFTCGIHVPAMATKQLIPDFETGIQYNLH